MRCWNWLERLIRLETSTYAIESSFVLYAEAFDPLYVCLKHSRLSEANIDETATSSKGTGDGCLKASEAEPSREMKSLASYVFCAAGDNLCTAHKAAY